MSQEITKDIVVMYHGNCPDGFTAAWAAWKKFGDTAEYIPLYRYLPVPMIKDKIVYMLDYCPHEKEILEKLSSENKEFIVIDHHVSEQETVKAASDYVFDVDHSGAFLAWQYFYPDKPVPRLVSHIEDYDLWKWKIPHTREISNIVRLKDVMNSTFPEWEVFMNEVENEATFADYIKQGTLIQKFKDMIINNILETQPQLVEMDGYTVYAVNASGFFADDLGNKLANKKPPFAIVWAQTTTRTRVSLRAGGDFDTTEISRKYRGGGHKGASAFHISLDDPLPWKVIKE